MQPIVFTVQLIKIYVCDLCIGFRAKTSTGWQQHVKLRKNRCLKTLKGRFNLLYYAVNPFSALINFTFHHQIGVQVSHR